MAVCTRDLSDFFIVCGVDSRIINKAGDLPTSFMASAICELDFANDEIRQIDIIKWLQANISGLWHSDTSPILDSNFRAMVKFVVSFANHSDAVQFALAWS